MSFFTSIVSIALTVTLLTSIGLAVALVSVRRQLRTMSEGQSHLEDLRRRRGSLEYQLNFLAFFVKDLAAYGRVLNSDISVREIPVAVHELLTKVFEPWEALVLWRRVWTQFEPDRGTQYIVAASTGKVVRVGTVVPMDEGDIGEVSRLNRAVDRKDLRSRGDQAETDPGESDPLFPFEVDLAAPLSIGDKNLGVLALSRPQRHSVYSKWVIDVIAQTTAMAIENAMALNDIRSESEIDPLTGILNKGALSACVEKELATARAKDRDVCVFLFDIDHFKNYNDINGHLAGDRLLRELSALVREEVRSGDTFGRFGGEEFLLVLPDRSLSIASFVAEKIRHKIENHSFAFAERQPLGKLTISGGVSSYRSGNQHKIDLVETADRALYQAKLGGRNRVVVAGPSHLDGMAKETGDETSDEPAALVLR